MDNERWRAVDAYLNDVFAPEDPVLRGILEANAAAGLPPHDVTPMQGKLLYLLTLLSGARSVLEIGTLGGYSTVWLGRALPAGGRILTLEANEHHAGVARANLASAALDAAVDLRIGPALDTLPQVEAEGLAPFDLVFIDADKPNNPEYFQWALRLGRKGTLIVLDNVVRQGAVADAESPDLGVQGVRRANQMMAADPRVEVTTIQTVGAKGYDGFSLALVVAAESDRRFP